ncbi:MAG: hypothetical protein ACOC0P_06560 [Planctomycetota bacterium]
MINPIRSLRHSRALLASTTRSIATVAALGLIASSSGIGGAALAQLTSAITSVRGDLSQSQTLVLEEHVSRYVADLREGEAEQIRIAREELARPLERPASSRDFRRAYDGLLTSELESILDNDETSVAAKINALIVLGRMASSDSIEVMAEHLESPMDAIRYASAMSYKLMFEQVVGEMHTFNLSSELSAIQSNLQDALAAERQPIVMHAQIQSIAAMPQPETAIEALTNALESQIADIHANGPGSEPEAATRRLLRVREGLDAAMRRYTDLIGANPSLRRSQQRELAITSAAILIAATDRSVEGDLTGDVKPMWDSLVRTTENILNVVTGQSRESNEVSDAFVGERYDEAQRALNRFWLSDTGPLYGEPIRDIDADDVQSALNG